MVLQLPTELGSLTNMARLDLNALLKEKPLNGTVSNHGNLRVVGLVRGPRRHAFPSVKMVRIFILQESYTMVRFIYFINLSVTIGNGASDKITISGFIPEQTYRNSECTSGWKTVCYLLHCY